jgi:hypothetical protein
MVVHRPDRDVALGCLGNALWLVFGGIWLALGHLVTGLLLCVTVVGVPLGIASFKMAGLELAPFGKEIVPAGTVPSSTRSLRATAFAGVASHRPVCGSLRRVDDGTHPSTAPLRRPVAAESQLRLASVGGGRRAVCAVSRPVAVH